MKFIFLALIFLIVLGLGIFPVTKLIDIRNVSNSVRVLSYETQEEEVAPSITPIPKPLLKNGANFPIISALGALAVDLDSGVTLYEKSPDTEFLPASTAKIMTALIAMNYYSRNQVIKVGKISIDGQKMNLVENEEISFENLLYGLLIYSANDASEVLAQNYPGGRDSFIIEMNKKTKELGLADTNFTNPSGLDGNTQFTTARDLVKLADFAMKDSLFAQIVATKEKTVQSIDGKVIHKLKNINKLVGEVEGVLGVKTGWTEEARENLVTYVVKGGKSVMIALLGSQNRFEETKELISWIFENYGWE